MAIFLFIKLLISQKFSPISLDYVIFEGTDVMGNYFLATYALFKGKLQKILFSLFEQILHKFRQVYCFRCFFYSQKSKFKKDKK